MGQGGGVQIRHCTTLSEEMWVHLHPCTPPWLWAWTGSLTNICKLYGIIHDTPLSHWTNRVCLRDLIGRISKLSEFLWHFSLSYQH